jgi:dihydrofolate reductase
MVWPEMGRLVYSAIASLDGYTADADGRFDWAAPSEEVHAFVNDLEREVGTYLYGRLMYETMAVWEDMPLEGESPAMRDYAAIWRAAEKVVYSSTLGGVSSARTRIERTFDIAAVRELKGQSSRDLSVGGPGLAAHAIRAGLVDEYQLLLVPVLVGGGTRALPEDVRIDLRLTGVRRFDNGTVFLRHAV